MTTSDQFSTYDEMDTDDEFVQSDEQLKSGSLASGEGVNRSLQRLARNTDALLDVMQTARNMVIAGGGSMRWNAGTGIFLRTAAIYLQMVNEVGGSVVNSFASGVPITLAAPGAVAYVLLDRAGATATPGVAASYGAYLAMIQGNANRLDYQVIAYRDGANLALWDGRRIVDGGLLTDDGCTDSQYGQQAELTTVHQNQVENQYMVIVGGGTLTWDAGTGFLSWTAPLFLIMPRAGGSNRILAGSAACGVGFVLAANLVRNSAGLTDIGFSYIADGDPGLDSDSLYVFAREHTDGRLYLSEKRIVRQL